MVRLMGQYEGRFIVSAFLLCVYCKDIFYWVLVVYQVNVLQLILVVTAFIGFSYFCY